MVVQVVQGVVDERINRGEDIVHVLDLDADDEVVEEVVDEWIKNGTLAFP